MDNAKIPSFWREEIWHPLSVHLPIVTLIIASLAAIASLLVKKQEASLFLKQLTIVMLAIGVASGWLAIYTGELAYNIEVRKLCDPKILQTHQWWGYCSLILYSVALAGVILKNIFFSQQAKLIQTIITIVLFAGMGTMVYVGHLGATLVYQQGAGTYQPTEDCTEFE